VLRKPTRHQDAAALEVDVEDTLRDERQRVAGVELEDVVRHPGGDVLPGPANDNLELDDGTLVPMIEDAIAAIDTTNGVVLLNPGFID